MHFVGAVGSAFKRSGDFRGRSSRSEYWYFFLLNLMIQVSALALDYAGAYPLFTTVAAVWSLVALVPGLSLFIRRLRDGGYSPWMSLFALAGPLGAVVFLVLLCQPSAADKPADVGSHTPVAAANVVDSGPSGRQKLPDYESKSSGSALLLGFCLVATLGVVLGSVSYVATQASMRDAEAEADASRASAAASSRAAAASSASASAEAARQAAAVAEASRLAKAAQEQREAEASRSAAASQAADAIARAYAAARDKLVSEGWYAGPDGVFYQWVSADQAMCPPYQRCVQLKVTTPDGCPNGVAVQASELTAGTVTGSSSAYSSGFLAGQNALVTLTTYDANADDVSIKKMTCH